MRSFCKRSCFHILFSITHVEFQNHDCEVQTIIKSIREERRLIHSIICFSGGCFLNEFNLLQEGFQRKYLTPLSRGEVLSLLLAKVMKKGTLFSVWRKEKFCEIIQNLNCSLAGPVLLNTSKKVNILDECVGNSCFLFPAPEEAWHWSHGLS